MPKKPTGGLIDVALEPGELSPQAGRYVRLLLDPKADPPTYVHDVPGMSRSKEQDPDPVTRFRREMARVGAEAVLYLGYNNLPEVVSYYVKILRFPSTSEAEKQWTLRRNGGESEVVTVAGAEVLFTKPGHMLRADLRAGMDTLECRAGRYWIRIAPAKPEIDDPGLKFVLKQMERIGKIREPAGAANAAPPHRCPLCSMQASKRSLIGCCAQAAVIALLACAVSCAHTSPTGSIGKKPTPFPEVIEKTVSWPEAVALIRGGSITRVSQTHALTVSLSGGGRRYFTREPEIDAVWHLVREVDPKHERILFGTE